ncbi:hypothetical protein [Actinomadura violacea]|uniref:Uncharacterized protein n=1 Tax=Actinomadura violacea TaxID=2819934 RepID=A0ABS3RXJ1_9ACTN|nr:hypothetical protein [Actinomadura violacea]MBO2461178.1 hypothetical protein [Actinomadura violacea]
MARTSLVATRLTATGAAPAPVTPDAAGVSFRNTGRCFLMVVNGAAASIDVTPVIGRQVKGQSVTSPPEPVAAGTTAFFGPFDDDYEQPGGKDLMYVNLSAVADVKVALLEMPL